MEKVMVHSLPSGLKVVCLEEKKEGRIIWKSPLGLNFVVQGRGMHINFQEIDQYNGIDHVLPNMAHVLFSYPANKDLAANYLKATTQVRASKAGIATPTLGQKEHLHRQGGVLS